MDNLKESERALAWATHWHPSFDGIAIVDPDFRFRSVNPQFCEILGVTPAELIGKNFADVTPHPVKELDILNAKLVKKRVIPSYLLPKTYEFSNGKRVNVVLLVVGVFDQQQNFLFYVSRILQDQKEGNTQLPSSSQKSATFLSQIKENWHIVAAILSSVALVCSYIIQELHLVKG